MHWTSTANTQASRSKLSLSTVFFRCWNVFTFGNFHPEQNGLIIKYVPLFGPQCNVNVYLVFRNAISIGKLFFLWITILTEGILHGKC